MRILLEKPNVYAGVEHSTPEDGALACCFWNERDWSSAEAGSICGLHPPFSCSLYPQSGAHKPECLSHEVSHKARKVIFLTPPFLPQDPHGSRGGAGRGAPKHWRQSVTGLAAGPPAHFVTGAPFSSDPVSPQLSTSFIRLSTKIQSSDLHSWTLPQHVKLLLNKCVHLSFGIGVLAMNLEWGRKNIFLFLHCMYFSSWLLSLTGVSGDLYQIRTCSVT